MRKLSGKVAIVTGAARGIGLSISQRLANDGAAVMMADISKDTVEETVANLDKQNGDLIDSYFGDLSAEANCNSLVEKTISKWGQVDIVVNNAGGGVILPFLEHTAETLKTTIDRNLWTVIWTCRAVLPYMVKKEYGRIINIGADSVRNGLWDHAAYNAAKGGVHGMTTGLAREFAKYDITINTVAPCAVSTPQLDEFCKKNPEYAARFISVIPKGRPAEMDEVAAMVNFLASDDASFITGQVISVNGGSTML